MWFQAFHAFQLLFDDRSPGSGRLRSRLCALSTDDVCALIDRAIAPRHRERSEAIETFFARPDGLPRRFRLRSSSTADKSLPCTNALRLLQAMTLIGPHTRLPSRGIICPKFCNRPCPRNQRAQGRPGARRTRGLMGDMGSQCCPRAYRFGGNTPAFPAQWLYGLYEIVLVTLPFVTPSPARSFHFSPT